jgi:hypothetical protein
MEEKETDIIILEDGEMFEGTREQFRDCFFNNAYDNVIYDWCKEQDIKLIIRDEKLIGYNL